MKYRYLKAMKEGAEKGNPSADLQKALDAEQERCAKICDAKAAAYHKGYMEGAEGFLEKMEASEMCARAIRTTVRG